MTTDWCPGIREACSHWRDAPMLQQTFEALEQALDQNNDACIDCAKTIIEVVCRVIIESFHTPLVPLKPIKETPTLSDWLSSAVRALKLGDIRDDKFKKLVSSHHKLASALNDLRNQAGPSSHGKDPYLERLAIHHRRSAVLSADAIVFFLHKAYLDAQLDPGNSREPWDRFAATNTLIDAHVRLTVETDDEGSPSLKFLLPGGDVLPLSIEVSRLLYQLDREAYVEALNAARSANSDEIGDKNQPPMLGAGAHGEEDIP
ncbi:MAG: abortive infection family protein [Halopseudomonas sabulinigri]